MNIFKYVGSRFLGLPTAGNESLSINYLTLSFTGELYQYEEEFHQDYFKKSVNPFRFSLILSMIFYGAFAFLDVATVYSLRGVFWFIRFGVVFPVLIAAFLFSYSRIFKKFMQFTISCIIFCSSFGIIVMIILAAKVGNYSYYAGLILISIFGYTFSRARFIYASMAGWSIVISYQITAIWVSHTPVTILISNDSFFISANVIGMFISYFLELSARIEYYMRIQLEQEKENVKTANDALEKRVEERTQQLSNANQDLKKEIEIRQKFERERAELEKQLFQLQKMETIGTLAGGIAHDFNNILTPILGYTDMALEELPAESNLRFDIEQINNAAHRGKDLVQQVLTFSREMDFENKPIQLQPIVAEALNLIKSSLPPSVEVKQHFDQNIGTVLADPTHIHQIVMNLCTNANHAMLKTGGILEVRLDSVKIDQRSAEKIPNLKKGEYIRMTISDTGHGMDIKTQERIFEPFFTRKEVGSGSGLGLSVVHGIINNYDGAIVVDSTPDKGTTFVIYLPKFGTDLMESDKSDKKPLKGDEYILFVDDEPEITFMGKKMLEKLGYKVTITTNSISAFEEFKKGPDKYSLLVTDQSMPNMSGTELAFMLKEIRPELKVIIITGFAENLSDEVISKSGISEVILKPMIFDDFSKIIRRVLDKIYVFDDEPSILLMIKKMLEKAGHEVDIALNGKEGMELFKYKVPDLLITDIIMPEKEGLETIFELRKTYPKLKIIAISGGGRISPSGYLPGAKLLGADMVFEKPLDQKKFLHAIALLLNETSTENFPRQL
jgi:signal transduction histidine kinase/CheY-like chemotaxis protein